jgi:hypothetical protein
MNLNTRISFDAGHTIFPALSGMNMGVDPLQSALSADSHQVKSSSVHDGLLLAGTGTGACFVLLRYNDRLANPLFQDYSVGSPLL